MSRHERWKLTCPECENNDMVYSSRPRAGDWLMMMLGKRPYRCLWCGARFLSGKAKERLPNVAPEPPATAGEESATCPNCETATRLTLGLAEQAQLQSEGWYVSCAKCGAAYVHRPRSTIKVSS